MTSLSNFTPINQNKAPYARRLYSSDSSQKYVCYEYSQGYEIVDCLTNTTIEFSPTSPSPYLGNDDRSYISTYDGPMNYGKVSTNEFKKRNFTIQERADDLDYNSQNLILNNYSSQYDSVIENYEVLANLSDFVRNDGKEYNKNGTCGYLAAAMILYYSKYQNNYSFIDDSFIEIKDGKRRFKEEFHDYLVSIGSNLGYSTNTDAFKIKDVMTEYCDRIGIQADHFAMLLSTPMNINMCINDNKPIALFGDFVSPSTGAKVKHAVTCYGTRDEPASQGKTIRYFIVNFGWTNYSKVYLIDNIFRNPVGSMYNMNY